MPRGTADRGDSVLQKVQYSCLDGRGGVGARCHHNAQWSAPWHLLQAKVEYYDIPEIRKWAGETTGCRFIHFAVVHNWRGIMSPMSAGFLSRHRFKYSDYKIMSLPVMEQGCRMYRHWQETTCGERAQMVCHRLKRGGLIRWCSWSFVDRCTNRFGGRTACRSIKLSREGRWILTLLCNPCWRDHHVRIDL